MPQFVQQLESRRMLSASANLSVDEARLALDVTSVIADARTARSNLATDGAAVAAQVKKLNLKNAPLGKALDSAIVAGRRKITGDVSHIVNAGMADGRKVFGDWLKLQHVDASNSSAVATATAKLATDAQKLWNVEQPFVAKVEADVTSTGANVGNAVAAIVNANKGDAALTTAWTTLQGTVGSAQTTLSADFSNLSADVNAVIADL